ncbi:hypothetical protein KY338_05565 [Candidatus Woesearchaeota archaeon]|nr:hypothetical protein [Candidatus Woesearchaeota archaeon]
MALAKNLRIFAYGKRESFVLVWQVVLVSSHFIDFVRLACRAVHKALFVFAGYGFVVPRLL